MIREVTEPPVEVLVALHSEWAHRVFGTTGEVAQIGRWVAFFEYQEDADGELLVTGSRYYAFDSDVNAIETLGLMEAAVD